MEYDLAFNCIVESKAAGYKQVKMKLLMKKYRFIRILSYLNLQLKRMAILSIQFLMTGEDSGKPETVLTKVMPEADCIIPESITCMCCTDKACSTNV